MYGLTEAFRATYLEPEQINIRPDSIGKAIPNTRILVLADNGEIAATNEEGELVQAGPLVCAGYWQKPEQTAKVFRKLPAELCESRDEVAVYSGDIVRRDDAGYLYFVGRKDGMIKSSGYRISPEEVERILSQFPAIAEACVFGLPDERLGHSLCAAIAPRLDHSVSEKELRSFCATHLASYMVPNRIFTLASLPKTPNGKIDRVALTARYSEPRPNAIERAV